MQDRFKFRAWDKIQKMYINNVQVGLSSYDHTSGHTEYLGFDDILNSKRYEVEQCTGLKDKNGKLIYEGDIVNDGEQYAKVIFDKSCFCYDDGSGWYEDLAFSHTRCEVIGNIHENLELLEDNK